MANTSPSIVYDNASAALFRAWSLAFHDALIAAGLTAHTQTGEMDFATVAAPSSGTQAMGFRCYKFNDGLTEIYLKFEYGSGGAGTLNPGVYLTVGYTLNGSGTFTGSNVSGRYMFNITAGNNGVTAITRFCKTTAGLAISTNEALAGTSAIEIVVCVGRSLTPSTGAPNADHAIVQTACTNNSIARNGGGYSRGTETVPSASAAPAAYLGSRDIICAIPRAPIASHATYGNGTYMAYAPTVGWRAGAKPCGTMIIGGTVDHATGDTPTAPLYGTNHVWRNSGLAPDGDLYGRILYIWE